MARRTRVLRPPSAPTPQLGHWFDQVAEALNTLPNFSIISTTGGPESSITADPGTIAFDIGSGVTRWYGKYVGSGTTGWVPFSIINTTGTGGAFSSAFSSVEFF